MSPDTFRDLLYSLSGLSFGAALYALVVHASKVRKNPRYHLGFIIGEVGWLMVAGMVFTTILVPITAVPATWQGYVYMVGLVLGTIGFIMTARK